MTECSGFRSEFHGGGASAPICPSSLGSFRGGACHAPELPLLDAGDFPLRSAFRDAATNSAIRFVSLQAIYKEAPDVPPGEIRRPGWCLPAPRSSGDEALFRGDPEAHSDRAGEAAFASMDFADLGERDPDVVVRVPAFAPEEDGPRAFGFNFDVFEEEGLLVVWHSEILKWIGG